METQPNPPPVQQAPLDVAGLRRAARWVLILSLGLAVALIVWAVIEKSLTYDVRMQLILTFLGLAVGALLANIGFGAVPHFRFGSRVALGLLITSQLAWYILVWTAAKKEPFYWRAWWLFVVGSITSAHLLALKMPAFARRDRLDKVTTGCAIVSGVMLAVFSFWKEIPAKPPTWYWILFAIPAVGSILGSILVYRRGRPRKDDKPVPMARWARTAWLLASQAAVFLVGVYVGRDPQMPSAMDHMTSALAGLTSEKLDQQLNLDLQRLRNIAASVEELTRKADALQKELMEKRKAEGRAFFRPDEEEKIRGQFVTYLSYRSALMGTAAMYHNFECVPEPELRARCFMLGYAAAGIAYEAALALVTAYANEAPIQRKLNEAEAAYGLPAGMYDRISRSVTNKSNMEMYQEMGAYYEHHREEWRAAALWPQGDYPWLDERITRSLGYVRAHPVSPSRRWFGDLVKRVKGDLYSPVYAGQTMLSTMIGDLRIVKDAPMIPVAKVKEIQSLLKPGDIFLERRNWYLSNAFLPGFWPHGALYIGTPEELKKLGIADHPEVKRRWAEYVRPAHDGQTHTVLESVSDGVIFNSVTESMHADNVAVLRPRLTPEQIGQAIIRAFTHQGKPYDFEFDFFTSDKLVCTELIYRAYEGMLHFELVRIMGRDTLPALNIGRKYARERNEASRELDFILFLDGTDGLANEEAFIGSLERPGAFGEKP